MTSITLENGQLVVFAKYHPALVADIKTIPPTDRKWDPNRKVWMVDPAFGKRLKSWIKDYLDEDVSLPQATSTPAVKVTQAFRVRYIGACKRRDDGSVSALGLVGQDWRLYFQEDVLRQWFDSGPVIPGQSATLYTVLGIQQLANAEEIKSAYRRMAKQWHPDLCKEPNANDVFIRIREAYTVLSNDFMRVRYDAGLKLEAGMRKSNTPAATEQNYRSPLRCGYLMVEGVEKINRFAVEKILAWEDITDSAGRTLVTSWAMGMKEPTEVWS